jgi:hypothetical protein
MQRAFFVGIIKKIKDFEMKVFFPSFLIVSLVVSGTVFFGLRSIFAKDTSRLFFEASSNELPPNSNVRLMIDSGVEQVAFARIVFSFDPAAINLSDEINVSGPLSNVVDVTTMADANASGLVEMDLGLPVENRDNPPSGIFEIANFNIHSVTAQINHQTAIDFSVDTIQIVDIAAENLLFDSESLVLMINPAAVSPTLGPTVTQTPTPVSTNTPTPTVAATPTPTPVPQAPASASLSLSADSPVYFEETFVAWLDLATNSETSGVDAVILFDPNMLEVEEVNKNNLLSDTTLTQIDNIGGTLLVSQLAPVGEYFNGNGVLASIVFRSKTIGSTQVSFDFSPGSKTESNVVAADTGEDILTQPAALSLDIIEHAYLNLHLTTDSENTILGFSEPGVISHDGGTWSSDFLTDNLGNSETWQLPDELINTENSFGVKVSGYLRRLVTKLIISGQNLLEVGKLVAGDLNDDGIINNIDLSLMYEMWFGAGLADYNKDGIVNSFDHWLLIQNFFNEDE